METYVSTNLSKTKKEKKEGFNLLTEEAHFIFNIKLP